MAINFPDSPSVGQDYTSGSTTWTWDGTAWNLKTTTTASNDSMPVGSIMWFAVTSTPNGWIPCDGSTYTNSTYPNLVAVIGTTFGGTAGVNFKVPTISATTGAYYIRYTTAVGVTSTLSLLSAPVGSMVQWPVTTSYPTGWVRCDGTTLSRTSYADLFNLIGTTYGNGDGTTTFTLPNINASGIGSPVYIIKATVSGVIEPSTVAHAASHIRGGSDIIDADRDQIDFVPTRYTRDSSPAQAGAVTDLTAHLKGIDTLSGQGHIVCTSSTRPSSPTTGTMIYETDTGFIVVYNGTTWIQMMTPSAPPAIQLINPTSVSGTGVSISNGSVVLSGASSAIINGVFSSTYDNYRVIVNTTQSGQGAQRFRFATSGTANSAASYFTSGIALDTSTSTISNNSTGSTTGTTLGFFVNYTFTTSGNDVGRTVADICDPYNARYTTCFSQGLGTATSAGRAQTYQQLGWFANTTSFDGLNVLADSGTLTGTVRIYGYRNNI